MERGRDADTPVAVIEDGFGPRQRTTVGTLATIAARIAEAGVQPPAIAVVGRVVTRAPEWSAWTDRPRTQDDDAARSATSDPADAL